MNPILSIVVPYRNRAAFLPDTLASLPTNVPIILVDNGSTDESARLCEAYAAQHPLVRCISQPEGGACAARNAGLNQVETEWVYFFDSDDIFSPEMVENVLPHLTADIDMLCLLVRQEIRGRLRVRAYRPTADPTDQILASHLATQNMLLRTDWLRQLGGWNGSARVWDDWELGLRILLRLDAEARASHQEPRLRWYTAEAFHHIRVHADSITGHHFSQRAEECLSTLRLAEQDLVGHETQFPGTTSRFRQALRLRRAIFCGHLLRESYSRQLPSPTSWQERLLTRYVQLGGRGAWRLATWSLCFS